MRGRVRDIALEVSSVAKRPTERDARKQLRGTCWAALGRMRLTPGAKPPHNHDGMHRRHRQSAASWTASALIVGAGLLSSGGQAVAAPGLRSNSEPLAVLDGDPVPECAWAPVVELYDGLGRCSGIYVGDRVVLTAARCVSRGFSVPLVGAACTDASDCPTCSQFIR